MTLCYRTGVSSIRPAEAFNVPHKGILNKPRPTLEYQIVGWGWKILENLINRGLEIDFLHL